MARVEVRYWAAVKAAAGVETDVVDAETVADVLGALRALHPSPEFSRVLGLCSLLRDGYAIRGDALGERLETDTHLEALPPFAGG